MFQNTIIAFVIMCFSLVLVSMALDAWDKESSAREAEARRYTQNFTPVTK